jgi:hypothetical protein
MDQVSAAGWQIVQRPDGLEVLLAHPPRGRRPGVGTPPQTALTALTAQGVATPPVRVHAVTAIARTALGKAPLVTKVGR